MRLSVAHNSLFILAQRTKNNKTNKAKKAPNGCLLLCKEQSAKCRIIRNLVGAIHESPENERLSFVMMGGGTPPMQ